MQRIPVFFHEAQLEFKPRYEWAFGKRIKHPETTARAESIAQELRRDAGAFEIFQPAKVPLSSIRETHNYQLLTLYNAASSLPPDETFYPRTFPKKSQAKADPTNLYHAGFFCYDSGTPLNQKTWTAASWSAACGVEAAKAIESGAHRLSYALSRPPGHHASREYFGGYCYFNNAALAAKKLRKKGRVVILDVDFHHGNGTQDIFYRDDGVFFISLHGDPRAYYPFVTGFSSESGTGPGAGYTLNFPLPSGTDWRSYERVLREQVIPNIKRFDPAFLVLSAGFDTYKLDPVGDFSFDTDDYGTMGDLIGSLGLPTVVIQEGGYFAKDLGRNVATLLRGLRDRIK